MTRLATLQVEASRKLGRRSRASAESGVSQRMRAERRWQRLSTALVPLCEARWAEIRGPRPAGALEQAVWEVAPPLADLFVHLYGSADARLAEALGRCTPAQALGVLVEVEIERGNPEGARLAYEAMMLFESPGARAAHTRNVVTRLERRGGEPDARARRARRPALWRALAAIAAAAGRYDVAAVLASVRLIARAQSATTGHGDDPRLQSLLESLSVLGVRFDELEDARLRYTLRGVRKPPIPVRRVATVLADLRRGRGL